MASWIETIILFSSLRFARSFLSLLCIIILLHRFQHLFHGILIFGLFMLYFPNFSKAAFPDNIKIIKYILLYLYVFYVILVQINVLHNLFEFFMTISCLLFAFMNRWIFVIFSLKSSFLLSIYHVVITKFMLNMIDVNIGNICFWYFFI